MSIRTELCQFVPRLAVLVNSEHAMLMRRLLRYGILANMCAKNWQNSPCFICPHLNEVLTHCHRNPAL